GLGGRLDVVNVVNPDIAVITNIGLDHTDWLGDTIEKIAFEKAGIIRPSIPVVFGGQQQIPQAILDKAAECQAQLYAINRDYFYEAFEDGQSWGFASSGITLRLPTGVLALDNISTAVAALLLSGLEVSQQALVQGIQNAKLPGRFEIRTIENKTVIFDAGHNPHGVEFLLRQLEQYLNHHPETPEVVCVFSILADKDINSVIGLLKDRVHSWKIAPLDVPRAAELSILTHALAGLPVATYDNVKSAFRSALDETNNNQLILVCGSFHTLEAVWECLEECQ